MYKIVERAEIPPAHCVISGFTDGPFIDTDADEPSLGPHIYLQVDVVKDLAKQTLGMVTKEEHSAITQLNEALEEEVASLKAELEDLHRQFDAIDTLASAGFRARNKPGRKPKEEKVPA